MPLLCPYGEPGSGALAGSRRLSFRSWQVPHGVGRSISKCREKKETLFWDMIRHMGHTQKARTWVWRSHVWNLEGRNDIWGTNSELIPSKSCSLSDYIKHFRNRSHLPLMKRSDQKNSVTFAKELQTLYPLRLIHKPTYCLIATGRPTGVNFLYKRDGPDFSFL